jgi:phosphoribosyl 1,2-cyclic phosphodiesterase
MHVQVLGSSSAGNATLVWLGDKALLVDCGFGPRYLERHLKSHGLRLASLSGVVVTHVHGDHVNELAVEALAERGVPLYCTPSVERPLLHGYRAVRSAARLGLLKTVRHTEAAIGPFQVEAFEVPHDSPGGCFGYRISDGTHIMTIATDLSHPERELIDRFVNSHVLVIESNHDPDMLENSRRPAWLKRRIRERGHLSNGECAGLVAGVLEKSHTLPSAVVVAHISQECNTNPLAVSCTADILKRRGYHDIPVVESHKNMPNVAVHAGNGTAASRA